MTEWEKEKAQIEKAAAKRASDVKWQIVKIEHPQKKITPNINIPDTVKVRIGEEEITFSRDGRPKIESGMTQVMELLGTPRWYSIDEAKKKYPVLAEIQKEAEQAIKG